MQKAPETSTKKTVMLVVLALILSALLLSVSIFLGKAKMESAQDEARVLQAQEAVASSQEIDLANKLRKITVDDVYAKEAIPAYSYAQVWNMDMSKPSGATVDDLKQVSRGAFVGLEDAFVKAEKDYDVNCLFVMGIASLESANGTICFKPNNMFGFGNRGFSSKAECIDVVARALANNYLTPGGGLYCGTRITDVNRRYAASSTWDEKVCRNVTNYYAIISQYHNSQLEKLK